MSSKKKTAPAETDLPVSTTVVVGDGWAALATLAHELTQTDHAVVWVAGSGSRLRGVLPGMAESGRAWSTIAAQLGIEVAPWSAGVAVTAGSGGSTLREFRNKSFKPLSQQDIEDAREWLSPGERRWSELGEGRFDRPFPEIEESIRHALLEGTFTRPAGAGAFRRIVGAPVTEIKLEEGALQAVVLASGETLPAQRLYACDRWADLPSWVGLPKGLPFLRKRDAHGVLQATFTHSPEVASVLSELREGYFGALHKEAGQEQERHVWGGFYTSLTGQPQSTWSVCLAPDEVQDNHTIAKRFRRMKTALDKMFAGVLGEGAFQKTIREESVLFEEEALFAGGEPPQGTIELPRIEGVYFLTDGYGPAQSIVQVSQAQGWVQLPTGLVGDTSVESAASAAYSEPQAAQ